MVKKKLYAYSNLIALVLGILFCFITYGPAGILIAIVTQIVLGLTLLLGIIPVIGVILYAWVAWFSFLPWVVTVFGVEWTWSLTALFVLNLIVSIGFTVQMIIRIFTVYWRL
ncbi:MAG: hypothetical protein JSV63_03760 [Candidatus Aenigmatarchaeota archaeon]|nr:MAG: hypothetical protein JSV63_03760 [Candidatus Aenigmarchaeota archaeon]